MCQHVLDCYIRPAADLMSEVNRNEKKKCSLHIIATSEKYSSAAYFAFYNTVISAIDGCL